MSLKRASEVQLQSVAKRIHVSSETGSVDMHAPSATSSTRRRAARRSNAKSGDRPAKLEQLRGTYYNLNVQDEGKCFRTIKEGQVFGDVDPLWREFAETFPEAIPEWFKPENYTMFRVSDASQAAHLQHFNRVPLEDFRAHKEAFEMGFLAAKLACEPLEKEEMPHMADIKDVPYRKHKFGGYTYRLKGAMTREEAQKWALPDAEDAWVRMKDGEMVEPDYVRLGGRGKVKKGSRAHHEEVKTVAGRLILMLSQRDLLLLGVTEKFATAMAKDDDNPIYVGKSWYFGGARRFVAALKEFVKFYCMDAEKYDSSLDPYLIRKGVEIVRSWFVDGEDEEYDVYWEFVIQSLITAPIMRDDGFCFRKTVGTTSGHSHNTLIQSIITIALGYGALFALNPELTVDKVVDNSKVFGLGDDNLIAIRAPLKEVLCEDIARVVEEATKIKWGGDKSFATTRLADPVDNYEDNEEGGEFEGVQFLGKYFKVETLEEDGIEWEDIIPYRPAWESLIKLAVPEREPSFRASQLYTLKQLFYLRALGMFIDNAGNHTVRTLCNQIMDWLEDQGVSAYVTEADRLFDEFEGFTQEEDTSGYYIKRLDYEGWLKLVLGEKKKVLQALRYDPYEGNHDMNID